MLIVSVDRFIHISGKYYCKPYSLLSLSQYWDVFPEVKLLGHEITGNIIPDGWLVIPEDIVFYPINGIDNLNPIIRKKIRNEIWDFIKEEKIAYLRMPDFRVLEIYKFIKNKIPYFCEFHGDWEESLLAQKLNTVDLKNKIKGFLANYRAKIAGQYYREIGENALVNISIGPRLIEKYNLDVKPSLATANHIIKKETIIVRDNYDLNKEVLSLLFVGELQHRKGLDYLIQALAKLKKDSNYKFSLSIVGIGYLDKELDAMVAAKGLKNDIHFKGAIYDRDTLEKEYKKANVFVLPSIAGEGVPRVLQEAQAFGCAIIATDIGSTYWQLQNDSGILIKSNSVQSLIDAIMTMYDDERRKELSLNATKNAYEFTYEKQKDDIAKFIHMHLKEYIHD